MNNTIPLPESQVVSMYQAGTTLNDLKKFFNIKSYGPIKRVLKTQGIVLRKKGELRPQDKHTVNLSFFETIDTPEKAYWLGFVVADGHIQQNNYKVSITSKDREIIEKFKIAIGSEHTITPNAIFDKRTNKTYRSWMIQITSKHFVSYLIKQGVTNAKSSFCDFPSIPEALYPHFIRGLFDGDGSICFIKSGKRRISLIATDSILNFIQKYLIEKFGFSTTEWSCISTNQKAKNSKLHIYNKRDQDTFLDFIYNPSTEETRLTRKYLLAQMPVILQKSGPKPYNKKQ